MTVFIIALIIAIVWAALKYGASTDRGKAFEAKYTAKSEAIAAERAAKE